MSHTKILYMTVGHTCISLILSLSLCVQGPRVKLMNAISNMPSKLFWYLTLSQLPSCPPPLPVSLSFP